MKHLKKYRFRGHPGLNWTYTRRRHEAILNLSDCLQEIFDKYGIKQRARRYVSGAFVTEIIWDIADDNHIRISNCNETNIHVIYSDIIKIKSMIENRIGFRINISIGSFIVEDHIIVEISGIPVGTTTPSMDFFHKKKGLGYSRNSGP